MAYRGSCIGYKGDTSSLNEVAERNTDPNRHLAIVFYNYRPLLAWVKHGGVDAEGDKDTVVKALNLKTS